MSLIVQSKRTIVSPNLDFLVELEGYERQLFPSLGPAPPVVSPDMPSVALAQLCAPSCECAKTSTSTVHPNEEVPHTPAYSARTTASALFGPDTVPVASRFDLTAAAAAVDTTTATRSASQPSSPAAHASAMPSLGPDSRTGSSSRLAVAQDGCSSPRLKSPFQVSLSITARTSPKTSRREPQSPFVPSPSSQGIFAL